MGLSGIGPWELLIVLVIVVLLFGTKKLKNVGGDLGSALKSFRGAMRDEEDHRQAGGSAEGPRDSLSSQEGESSDAQFTRSSSEQAEDTRKEKS